MKVLCINNNFRESILTIDKWYNVILETGAEEYIIIDDNGDNSFISIHRFKTIDEVREEKLNELGI